MPNKALMRECPRRPLVVAIGAAQIGRMGDSDTAPQRNAACSLQTPGRISGAAFQAAAALRARGADVHLVSAAGGDADAERIGEELERLGIGDGRIIWLDRRSPDWTEPSHFPGGNAGGVLDTELYDRLVPRILSRRHLRARLEAADGLLVDANLPAASIRYLAAAHPKRPLAAIAVSPEKAPRFTETLPRLSMLFATRRAAESVLDLAPDTQDNEIVRAAISAGAQRAVITDGPRRVLVVDGVVAWRQPCPPTELEHCVLRSIGTLAGATFAAWLTGHRLLEAARIGLAAVTLVGETQADAVSIMKIITAYRDFPVPEIVAG